MKLLSMTDFVLHESFGVGNEIINKGIFYNKCSNYANFLKQPLKLEMFVPCDDNGSVLEHPIYTTNHSDECYCKGCEEETKRCSDLQNQYQKAKEKVFFEGFVYTDSQKYSYLNRIPLSVSPYGLKNERLQLTKLKEDNKFHTWLQLYTIEDLIKCDLDLTQNAIKQLGL